MSSSTHSSNARETREYVLGMRIDLQGMRAFAVLAVFADHLLGWPHGGFVGVDVFFVLSGFFITGLLIGERTYTGRISFRNFYVRRVRRIIPSATLVIVVTVIASFVLLTTIRAKNAAIDGLWASIFLSNWRFERVGTDYFAQGQPDSPLLHYWSLSIEEQFYFVWPLLLLGLFALTRRYSKPGNRYPARRQVWLGGFMAAICVASFAWACIQTSFDPTGAYFSTLTRVWELGVGALLAIAAPLLGRIPDNIRPAMSYVGLAGAVASLFVISADTMFPGPWAALPVLSTALVIAAFVGADVRAVPHLTNPVAQYIGEVSYTLYLWHWPVIILLAAVMAPGPVYYVVAIVLALALTAVTYRYFENPIRRSEWLDEGTRYGATPKEWAAFGAVAAVVIVGLGTAMEFRENRSSSSQANQELVVAVDAPVFEETRRCLGAAALITEGCVLYDPEVELSPSIETFADDTQGAYKCYRGQGDPLEACDYGYKGEDGKRIAVIGDSHAAMLLPALSPYLIENKWQVTTFVGNGCQWMINEGDDCSSIINEVQARLLAEPFDLVITTSSRAKSIGGGGIRNYMNAWEPVSVKSKILVVADIPGVTPETLACVTRVGGNPGECSTPRAVALADADPLIEAAGRVPGVQVIDLTDSFCDADKCPAVIGNVIVYRDAAAHMSATYAQTVAPRIVDVIKQMLG